MKKSFKFASLAIILLASAQSAVAVVTMSLPTNHGVRGPGDAVTFRGGAWLDGGYFSDAERELNNSRLTIHPIDVETRSTPQPLTRDEVIKRTEPDLTLRQKRAYEMRLKELVTHNQAIINEMESRKRNYLLSPNDIMRLRDLKIANDEIAKFLESGMTSWKNVRLSVNLAAVTLGEESRAAELFKHMNKSFAPALEKALKKALPLAGFAFSLNALSAETGVAGTQAQQSAARLHDDTRTTSTVGRTSSFTEKAATEEAEGQR